MVSKASEDLPDPLSPVITVSVLRGISTLMFFRLCWRAPRTVMFLMAMRLDVADAVRDPHRAVQKRVNATVLPYLNRQYPCWSNEGRVVFRARCMEGHAPSFA